MISFTARDIENNNQIIESIVKLNFVYFEIRNNKNEDNIENIEISKEDAIELANYILKIYG